MVPVFGVALRRQVPYRVVLTDQVFPDLETEQQILSEIDAEIVIADPTKQDPIELARDADAILNTYFPIPATAIDRLRRCRVIARYGIGIDNIDVGAARHAGITVTNVPDYSVEEVSVHTLMLILASIRRVTAATSLVESGGWAVSNLRPIARVSELAIGIVGLGKIGRAVATLAKPLGARLIGFDPYATSAPDGIELATDLATLLAEADVVTLHVPANESTHHLIDKKALDLMRSSAVLINTSRGALIDTFSLIDALRQKSIAFAALDVLESEPGDAHRFSGLSNVLITPHMAYYSESSIAESQRKAATQIVKVLRGEPPDYPVN